MLPQNHAWQVTLREWMAGKTLACYDCGLPGLSYSESYFADGDDLLRAWLTFEDLGRNITKITGARIDASHYLLENIESADGIRMRLYETVEPGALAWLYSWNYPGNPYYQSAEIANRALTACMVDMIMAHDHYIDGNLQSISQDVSSMFATWAYCFDVLGGEMPNGVSIEFSRGLTDFFDRIEAQGPTGIQSDLDLPALVGMYYTAKQFHADSDTNRSERAEAYARAFMDNYYNPAGFGDHGGALDPGYNGIWIKYLTWAAHVTGYDFLTDALEKIHELKAHLTFYDQDKPYGPSSFATSTTDGSPRDQHWIYGRDVAASFLTSAADYLRYHSRDLPEWWQPFGVKSAADMKTQLAAWTLRANTQETNPAFGTWTRASDLQPAIWSNSLHLAIPRLVWDYYPADFYADFVVGGNPPLDPGDYIREFGEEFVVWQLGGISGAVHTGGRSWWQLKDGVALPGLAGGICALQFDEMGIGVLGRNRGYPGSTPDTMANVDTWAVNHVWGMVDGAPVSSALDGAQQVNVVSDGDSVMVSSGTEIGTRIIDINAERIQVSVIASEQLKENASSIYETIPLWMGDGYDFGDRLPAIHLRMAGNWVEIIPNSFFMVCDAVKLERNGRLLLIEFEKEEAVRLGPVWSSGYQRKSERIVPLHIAITQHKAVRYKINGPYKHELVKA